eukprot:TRINITY_DN278_c0_g5_i1.p1 TRINITY_DN278_c0_g5~~TRINITY_DN278_c0_g5_i1.p1  ORF type:complete len:743 (+),score=212.06 TRINITY_DN278_c0_g5_i1:76-2304(+)
MSDFRPMNHPGRGPGRGARPRGPRGRPRPPKFEVGLAIVIMEQFLDSKSKKLNNLVPIDAYSLLRRLKRSHDGFPIENTDRIIRCIKELSHKRLVKFDDFVQDGMKNTMVLSVDLDAMREVHADLKTNNPTATVSKLPPHMQQQLPFGNPQMNPSSGGMLGPRPIYGPRGGQPRGMGMLPRARGMPPLRQNLPGGISNANNTPIAQNKSLLGSAIPGADNSNVANKMNDGENKKNENNLEGLFDTPSAKQKDALNDNEEMENLLEGQTAKEQELTDSVKSAGRAVSERCPHLTKEICYEKKGGKPCSLVHFRKLIQSHTNESLGDCSYLDHCRSVETCRHVHYVRDDKETQITQVLSENPPQWLNGDVRKIDFEHLGKFDIVMTDPPWSIHMDVPYGTLEDYEFYKLGFEKLQDNGVLFMWVTTRCLELGRRMLTSWGYRQTDELIWVKLEQLEGLTRTGQTGHWLNHSKEHCLVAVKGSPQFNFRLDTDVLVSKLRETSRKPDELYSMIERLSPGTRKIEVFARQNNIRPGWMGIGNQLWDSFVCDADMIERLKGSFFKDNDYKHPLYIPEFDHLHDEAIKAQAMIYKGMSETPQYLLQPLRPLPMMIGAKGVATATVNPMAAQMMQANMAVMQNQAQKVAMAQQGVNPTKPTGLNPMATAMMKTAAHLGNPNMNTNGDNSQDDQNPSQPTNPMMAPPMKMKPGMGNQMNPMMAQQMMMRMMMQQQQQQQPPQQQQPNFRM